MVTIQVCDHDILVGIKKCVRLKVGAFGGDRCEPGEIRCASSWRKFHRLKVGALSGVRFEVRPSADGGGKRLCRLTLGLRFEARRAEGGALSGVRFEV